MPPRPLARAVAVGLAALAVLCPERTLAKVADARNLPQQLATLFDEAVVIDGSHVRLHLYPNKRNRYRRENMAFLNLAKSGRTPLDSSRRRDEGAKVIVNNQVAVPDPLLQFGRLNQEGVSERLHDLA